ncbi:MAG: hypothetical protein JRN51_08850, partial [Nitrososphaerota archaeon]|nr:hypothetical protein [Nitrososphaerota archaeon]
MGVLLGSVLACFFLLRWGLAGVRSGLLGVLPHFRRSVFRIDGLLSFLSFLASSCALPVLLARY